MTRLPNEPDITVRNEVNNSFINDEYMITNVVPISRAYLSGPFEAYYNRYDPLNVASISAVDPKKLELAKNRRPFFEEKYFYLHNEMDKANVGLMPYLGSGTLAADEVELSGFAPEIASNAVGIPVSSFLAYQNTLVGNGKSFGDVYASALDAFFGERVIELLGASTVNKIYSSKVVGGGISSWLVGISGAGRTEEDKVWAAQRQGWGRNIVFNEYILENYNNDMPVTSVYPNIHTRFYNPIWGCGGRAALGYSNKAIAPGAGTHTFFNPTNNGSVTSLPNIDDYYPRHKSPANLYAGNSHLAAPIFSHYESIDLSSGILHGSVNPTDFLTDVNHSITVTATYGFSANGIHSGGTLVNPVIYNGLNYYANTHINYKKEGINRIRMFIYRPFAFTKANYFGYSGLDGASVQSIIGPEYVTRPLYYNFETGFGGDGRFNSGFVYDVKYDKNLYVSNISTTATNDQFIKPTDGWSYLTYYTNEGNGGGYTYVTQDDYVGGVYRNKIHYPPSPYSASSPYQAMGLERLSTNYWNLKPICYAAVTKLYDKGYESFNGFYRAPTKLSMGVNPVLGKNDFMGLDFTAVGTSSFTKYWQDLTFNSGGLSIGSYTPLLQSIPAGWTCWQYFMVIGENGADVRSKIKYLYDSGELDDEPTEEDVPDVFKKRLGVAKSKHIY